MRIVQFADGTYTLARGRLFWTTFLYSQRMWTVYPSLAHRYSTLAAVQDAWYEYQHYKDPHTYKDV